MTQTPTPTTSTFHPRPGDRHEPARDAGSRPDQPAQSAPGTQRHPSQRPADRPGDPRQSTPQPEVNDRATRRVAGQLNRVSEPRVTRTSPAVPHVSEGSTRPFRRSAP